MANNSKDKSQENTKNKKFRIGEILVNQGYITTEELQQALAVQKEQKIYKPLGQICVDLKFISSIDLSKILRKHQKHMYLGELLVNMGLINQDQLEEVLRKQKQEKKRLGELLIECGYLTENQLAKSLSMQLGIPSITPDINLIDRTLPLRFSEAFLRRQEAVPAFEKDNLLTLIMADPLSDSIINDFKKYFNVEIETAIATRSEIHHLLDAIFNKIEYGLKAVDSNDGKDLIIGKENYGKDTKDGIVKIVNYIISCAIAEGASDIHIEPQSYNLRVRYRIDGVLQHKTDLPKQMSPSIVTRIKVMGSMNIAEHRKHQDGRIEARILDNDIDLRVSVYAAAYGENIVIRILKRRTNLIDMNKLGFSPIHMKRFKKILDAPTGIILVCGPTGSGKTTTLYASINHLNQMEKKIITVEDPVEYTMDGVVQGQLNTKVGMNYSEFIAAMMRQDPDVIMIGEIRDNIGAEATIQAALTGHKAFSTFHTEDSTGALLRLMDMGIETFLISSTVVSVVAQRLIRTNCEQCKEPYTPDESIFDSFGIKDVDVSKYAFYRGRGCELCHNTGYKGRIGIHEILLVNDHIRDAILNRRISSEIRRIARESAGMITMREDGFYKATKGITTLEEVLRVVFYSDAEQSTPRSADEIIRHINGEEIDFNYQPEEGPTTAPSVNISLQVSEKEGGITGPVSIPENQLQSGIAQASGPSVSHQEVTAVSSSGPFASHQEITAVSSPGPGQKPPTSVNTFTNAGMHRDNSGTVMVSSKKEITEKSKPHRKNDNKAKMLGEVYRIRFESDTITMEQNRIHELFQRYCTLQKEFGEELSEDLLLDFIDFIVYHTSLSQVKYGAMFVEFFLKVVEEKPKIFMQYQTDRRSDSSYINRVRGKRLLEFMV